MKKKNPQKIPDCQNRSKI